MFPAILCAAVAGLLAGSFLNVVAHRLPRGESLLRPRSRCPGCRAQIAAYDNVPVISWLLLRGRCRHCGEQISPRYPLVEASTALLWALVVATQDDALEVVLGLLLVTALVPITLIDLELRVIPNRITGLVVIAALAAGLALDVGFVPEQLFAAAAAGGFFLLAAVAKPGGMGMGDVKLAGAMGLCLGRAVAPAIFIALVSGVLVGVVVRARMGTTAGRRAKVPFGPFLALGGVVALLAGDALVDAYLTHF